MFLFPDFSYTLTGNYWIKNQFIPNNTDSTYSAFIDSKVEKKSAKRDLSTYCLILFKIYSSSIKVPIRN